MSAHHITPAQRLASVVSKCFETQPRETRDALRHVVYSAFVGRLIMHSDELTDDEIKRMLERFEHDQSPFLPSEYAMKECNTVARTWQEQHGQTEMSL